MVESELTCLVRTSSTCWAQFPSLYMGGWWSPLLLVTQLVVSHGSVFVKCDRCWFARLVARRGAHHKLTGWGWAGRSPDRFAYLLFPRLPASPARGRRAASSHFLVRIPRSFFCVLLLPGLPPSSSPSCTCGSHLLAIVPRLFLPSIITPPLT